MTQLSLIFKDSFADVGDDNLVCTCQMISSICDASILSHESLRGSASSISPEFLFSMGSMVARAFHAVSSDSQRNNHSLEVECANLKGELLNKTQEEDTLRQRNNQLVATENEFLEKEQNYQRDIEILQAKSFAEIERLEAKFVDRDTTFCRFNKNLKATVSNLTKDVIRIRDGTIKEEVGELCSEHHILKT
ncbi:hypothetical protein C5167_008177, partial [Papaver somniferum]